MLLRMIRYISLQLAANCIAAKRCLRYYVKLFWDQPPTTQFLPSLTFLSIKTWLKWPPVLTATVSFPSVLFQLPQYPRQHPSFSAYKAALMTKTDSIFPAFSLRFVDFAVLFCFRCKFLEKPFESSLTVAWFKFMTDCRSYTQLWN